MQKEAEKQRKIEEENIERLKQIEEKRSREFQSKLKKSKTTYQMSNNPLSRQDSFQSMSSRSRIPENYSPRKEPEINIEENLRSSAALL